VGVTEKVTNSAVCFGGCLESQGNLGTDRLFTGQRLDNSGLYYYGARYYDPTIGRFISADTIVPNPANPQSLNRYTYCLNNPLKYSDPTGQDEICNPYVLPYWMISQMSSEDLNYLRNNYDTFTYTMSTQQPIIPEMPRPEVPLIHISDITSPDFNGTTFMSGLAFSGVLVADDPTGVGFFDDVAIPVIILGAGIITVAQNWDYFSDKASDFSSWLSVSFASSAQDQKLSADEVQRLESGSGETAEEIKGEKHAGQRDLYKKPNGDIVVKPKGGKGPGEPTGYNINDY
jgi:RHS repeat-associated protein